MSWLVRLARLASWVLAGRAMQREAARNRDAADRLDAALKELTER